MKHGRRVDEAGLLRLPHKFSGMPEVRAIPPHQHGVNQAQIGA
jgi:hypothetical protein